MSTCEHCKDGIVSQGESIKKVCEYCAGTGKAVDGEVTASAPVKDDE